MSILDQIAGQTGCHHPDQTQTDANGDPCCHDCHTEWHDLPDQR